MAEDTKISWADATFNPWIGCMKVGPACDGCYAEALMGVPGRFGPARVEWGAPGVGVGTRSRTAPSNWAKVRKWNREQEAKEKAWADGFPCVPHPAPRFVFCASLADVFDNHRDLGPWRRDLFDLIRATPHLTYLLLTKRPQNIVRLYREAMLDLPDGGSGQDWPKNAAIGCTVVNQEEADRDVPHLLAAKSELKPAFAFLSMEPLLGPVNIEAFVGPADIPMFTPAAMLCRDLPGAELCRRDGPHYPREFGCRWSDVNNDGAPGHIDWVITGGETDQGGHKARPQHPDWFRSLRDQCAAAGVAYHHKQNGEWVSVSEVEGRGGEPMHKFDDGSTVRRVGKDRSGRLIDGVLHDARPAVAQ